MNTEEEANTDMRSRLNAMGDVLSLLHGYQDALDHASVALALDTLAGYAKQAATAARVATHG